MGPRPASGVHTSGVDGDVPPGEPTGSTGEVVTLPMLGRGPRWGALLLGCPPDMDSTGQRAGGRPGPGVALAEGLAVSDHSRLRAAGAQQVKEATESPVMDSQ